MVQHSTYIQLALDAGEAVSLFRTQDCLLRCLSGKIWVTEVDGGGDIVLAAGDAYPLTRRGRTVIQAVGQQHGATCQLTQATHDRACRRTAAALRDWAFALRASPT